MHLHADSSSVLCMQVTKSQVAEILDSKGQELVNNVEALLLAVKSTNDFEAEMARRFGGSISEDTEHEVQIPCPAAFGHFTSHSFVLLMHSLSPHLDSLVLYDVR